MKKTVDYNIEYNEEGAFGVVPVTISFISRAVLREYDAITEIQNETSVKYYELLKVQTDLENSKDKQEADLAGLMKNVVRLVSELKSDKFVNLPTRRFNLIIKILKQNGYIEGKLLDQNYWDECIDPSTEIEFLKVAITKDLDKKKSQ
jgi:hypothetical protein